MKVLLLLLWFATGGLAYYIYQEEEATKVLAHASADSLQREYQTKIDEMAAQIAELKKNLAGAEPYQAKFTADETTIDDLKSQLSVLQDKFDALNARHEAVATAPTTVPTNSVGPAGEEWTTSDGRQYHAVRVVKFESDAVTIIDDAGGARIPLALLSPDLQKRFGYNALAAAPAAALPPKP